MSRAYRINVSESLDRVFALEDGVATKLEIIAILPQASMSELLRQALKDRGFVAVDDEKNVLELRPEDGIVVRVDVDSGQLEARAFGEKRVELERTQSRTVTDEEQGRAALERSVRAALESEAEAEAEAARKSLTRRLEDQIAAVQPLVDAAVRETTARALETRARQLGEIESIEEDPSTGSMVIRVKV